MNRRRRSFLVLAAGSGALVASGVRPMSARAATWNKPGFEAKAANDAIHNLGAANLVESRDIAITAPDIAENGAVVPFTIASKIPNTQNIALLIEKNPNTLAANFAIPEGTDPWVNTRVKMAQTSNVIALVKGGDGKFYYASKEVKVTLGGCGG